MFHVVCKHGFTENQTGTTPILVQDMGHDIDFPDIRVYDHVDRSNANLRAVEKEDLPLITEWTASSDFMGECVALWK